MAGRSQTNRTRPLPTPWNVYNLEASPYFQDTLEAAEHSTAPLSLFVGREAELSEMRSKIHGADRFGSRQAVAGIPGVGKTTLVQELKALLLEDGYLTTDSFVPILPGTTSERLFARVLGALYDTILANQPQTISAPAMRDAQILVRGTRLVTSRGGTLAVAGFGGGATSSVTPSAPADIMIDGPRIMRDLMNLVRTSNARGVLVHVNNLETLSEADAAGAADVLRALRDPMLMHGRLHFVLVGTTEAVGITVNSHAQVRNIFSTVALGPLSVEDVHQMLRARYEHLRLERDRSVIPPAHPDAVEVLYGLFRGDLRGLLKALEDGVFPLLGLATGGPEASHGVRPISSSEIREVLQERYAQELAFLAEQTRVDQVTQWGTQNPDALHTQQSLTKLWAISQPAVSNALSFLVEKGFVISLPREGREPTRYLLSGVGKLVFGGSKDADPA